MYEFDGRNWKDSHHDMKEGRSGRHTCVVVEDQIIVVGGLDGSNYLKTSEIFNIQDRSWRSGPELPKGIGWAQLVKAREGMRYSAYLIGGEDGSSVLSSIYGLTKDLERFVKIGDLEKARSSHVAFTIPEDTIKRCDKT